MMESLRTNDSAAADRMVLLGRDFQAHIVNFSPNGCLLQTNLPLDVGTVGTLRFFLDGREFLDSVQVVRCQAIEGAGSQYQVGAKFLWTMAHGKESLRRALALLVGVKPIRLVE